MIYGLSYKLRLMEPLLAGSLSGDANSARSLSFVPGALLRGAIIGLSSTRLEAAEEETRRLFLDGRTRYLNAYLLLAGERHRGLPLPLSWYREKHEVVENCRLFDLCETVGEEEQELKSLPTDYVCQISNQQALGLQRQDYFNVHTQRDPEKGRSTSEEGAVFRYESLAAGQVFGGIILTENAADATHLKVLLAGRRFRMGKSRTAGYGLVEIEEVADLRPTWRETSGSRLQDTDSFTLACLSEVLVRDARGQFTLDPKPALEKSLGVALTPSPHPETDAPLVFRRAEIVGGFNRKWGLPLPQVAAIGVGSVFAFTAGKTIPAADLQKLEEEGLGERRAEGFGRVAVNWFNEAPERFVEDKSKPPTRADHAINLSAAERGLVQGMLARHQRRELERLLLNAVNHLDISEKPALPNSQLARWRSVIHSALAVENPEKQLERLNEFRAHEAEKNSRAWEGLRRARVKDKGLRLTEWIDDVLTNEKDPWRWFPEKPAPLQLGADVQSEISQALIVEFRLRLLDGVLARHAKRQVERKGQNRRNR